MSDEQLSKNFKLSEFACKCGCGYEKKPAIKAQLKKLCVTILQPLRELAGPLTISSGARCPNWNKAVGGEDQSFHTKGQASDVQSAKYAPAQLVALALKNIKAVGGYNAYDTFSHFDTGPRRTW